MSDQLFIMLQCLLAFGVPLTLAVIELIKLRKTTPAPVGGGEPELVNVTPFPSRGKLAPQPLLIGDEPELKRAA